MMNRLVNKVLDGSRLTMTMIVIHTANPYLVHGS